MHALAASELLDLWERGAARHPLDRSALLAAAARPDLAPGAVADLPLGEVTASLLDLRAATFGPRITGHVDCERCGERLELAIDADTLRQPRPASDSEAQRIAEVAGRRLRPPSLRDLAAVAGERDAERAVRRLLDLCTLAGEDGPVGDETLRVMEDALEAIEPNADLAVVLCCVACDHENVAALDIGALLWDEIAACARRLLDEVHRLARAYGWTEAEILGLSPMRRAGYLSMVGP